MRRRQRHIFHVLTIIAAALSPTICAATAANQPLAATMRALGGGMLSVAPVWRTEKIIGIDKARNRYHHLPTGKGVVAGHVESGRGKYMPIRKHFRGVRFIEETGPSKISYHTNTTAHIIYGLHGLAPGIRLVYDFDAGDWLATAYLHAGTQQPPDPDSRIALFNDSWIARDEPFARNILRRVDYQIDRKHVVMCVAVNNGRKTPVPSVLGSAYNVIAVGVASGNSSGGYTHVAVAGRCKPDLVAPNALTSFATPIVTGCAARLIQAGHAIAAAASSGQFARQHAARPQVVKALLMGGATKGKHWHRAKGKPLANHLGAGLVNFYNSYTMLKLGPEGPGRITRRFGWDCRDLGPDQTATYRFQTPMPLGHATVMLVWDRHILGRTVVDFKSRQLQWLTTPSLAHFYLLLKRVNDDGSTTIMASSKSDIDNVQLVFKRSLAPGRYEIQVVRQHVESDAWPYALAWCFHKPAPPKPKRKTRSVAKRKNGSENGSTDKHR